jgi:hypothetical protein
MNIDSRSLLSFLAMLAFAGVATFATPAYAKTAAAPTIDQFYADPADQFTPGTELTFTLEGTPGGKASIRLTGIQRAIPLQEAESGVYEGSYTIRTRDRLSADSAMRATLRVRGKSAIKSQPLGSRGTAEAAAPAAGSGKTGVNLALANFTVAPVARIEPGAELKFTIIGSAGAKASFTIENIARDMPMREVKPGQYEGSYTVRRSDRFPADPRITGTLEANGQTSSMRLAQPVVQDAQSTAFKNVSPRDRETVTANPVVISGSFDAAAGIDPKTVRIVVAGNDVTGNAAVTPQFFTYRADMRPGSYPVEVTARDKSGNALRHAWTFTVSAQAGSAAAASSLPLQILSHADNAQVPGGPVELRGRTAPGADVAITVQATAALAGAFGLSQQVVNETMRADQAGNFAVTFQSPLPVPGTRFEIAVIASKGGLTKETRLVLLQQR